MATTLKAVVNKDRRRRDGTYTVRIRLTKDRSTVYLDTPFATQTPDIREKDVRAAAEKYIAQLREKIAALGTEAIHITASELKSRLNNNVKTDVKQRLADRAERQEREGKPACAANTRCTLNRLAEYHANPLDYTEVTPQLLRGLEAHLRKTCGDRGVQFHISTIRAVWHEIDREQSQPVRSPFGPYRLPQPRQTRKRNASGQTIRTIAAAEPEGKREQLGRDVLLLGVCLCGINTVDLYKLAKPIGDIIEAERSKTGAHIEMRAHTIIRPYMESHEGAGGKMFDFAERYKSPQEFNRAVNKGLERLCAKLQIPKLTYYAARHTWATVAHNECDVPEDVIAQALAHTPSTVTSLYINRDRRAVDKANDKVLKTLFGKKQIFR